jgi:hypothetical protein
MDKSENVTISPLRHRWNQVWPPVAIAVVLVVNVMWVSLLAYLVFNLADYMNIV